MKKKNYSLLLKTLSKVCFSWRRTTFTVVNRNTIKTLRVREKTLFVNHKNFSQFQNQTWKKLRIKTYELSANNSISSHWITTQRWSKALLKKTASRKKLILWREIKITISFTCPLKNKQNNKKHLRLETIVQFLKKWIKRRVIKVFLLR